MNAVRKRKMIMIVFILTVLSIALALVLYALRQNISLFYTPSEVAMGKAPAHHSIRMGGMVKKGTIVRASKGLEVQFEITDFDKTITVIYTGILPDLFREGQGIVAQGEIIDLRHFRATTILAKHDENYMPPEVKASLKNKGSS